MKTFIGVLMLLSTLSVFSQTVNYTYDAAGNRTARTVTVVAKAPQAPLTTNEVESVTELSNVITEKDFLVYPNPTQGHFTVEINNMPHDMKGEAYLYDSNGRLIEKKSIHSHHSHNKLNFNISHKSAGMYILNIRLNENTFTWKIIKK
ncbi:MAG: T9SS type A sorting domain-containing protein [Candidatus Azobacteroides sp.]|nr:T9SS type A sorting domain-containing protein [Candidatus Azobacteroides sp.]